MKGRLVAFALALAVAVGGMAWISVMALRLDAEEAAARRRARLEEAARLALWRMDSAIAPIVAREAGRSVESWTSTPLTDGEVLRYEERRSGEDAAAGYASATVATKAARQMYRNAPPKPKDGNTELDEQTLMNYVEWNARAEGVALQQEAAAPRTVGTLEPAWVGGELALVRTVEGRGLVQVCVLDWRALRAKMLGDIRELLPGAALEPASATVDPVGERLLASVPVRLLPGDLAVTSGRNPVKLVLAVAWSAFLLAAIAVGVLLVGTLALGERRRAFVSTVTHELRTPLTTLQTYSEMLAEGMIKDEKKRGEYLGTLRSEATRLGHLVENVLSYSRIEQGRGGDRTRVVTMSALVEAARARLGEIEVDVADPEVKVHADPLAVEQILGNLVDNARKYGKAPIHLEARAAELRVRDEGTGVRDEDRKALFTPFHKSVQRAAVSAPGVGLGLALSRRLARAMGGELRHEAGSTFVLSLRRA